MSFSSACTFQIYANVYFVSHAHLKLNSGAELMQDSVQRKLKRWNFNYSGGLRTMEGGIRKVWSY